MAVRDPQTMYEEIEAALEDDLRFWKEDAHAHCVQNRFVKQ